MRAAPAIGVSLTGERAPDTETPWKVPVLYGEVVLSCRWPASASGLRGALVAALGDRAHIDHHNHLGTDEDGRDITRQAPATVMYRVRDRDKAPVVWAYGPRAADHLAAIARITSLQTPLGDVARIESAALSLDTIEVGVSRDAWHRYELVTPYFCPVNVSMRRPRGPGPERDAWAAGALGASIMRWHANIGLTTQQHRPIVVHLCDWYHQEVQWRSKREAFSFGFGARFISNAILLPGLGLGQHVSEGWGEVRPWR